MGLRSFMDALGRHVQKGSKYEKLHTFYEAMDTFLYRPASVTRTTSHVRDSLDLKRMIILV